MFLGSYRLLHLRREKLHLLAFALHGGMNVKIHRCRNGGVTEYLCKGFRVEARLDASGRKGMAKRVKRVVLDTVPAQKVFIAYIEGVRFCEAVRSR